MSATENARQQAERIIQVIEEERPVDLPPEVDVQDIAEVIDVTVPFPVNLNRVLEQFVGE